MGVILGSTLRRSKGKAEVVVLVEGVSEGLQGLYGVGFSWMLATRTALCLNGINEQRCTVSARSVPKSGYMVQVLEDSMHICMAIYNVWSLAEL